MPIIPKSSKVRFILIILFLAVIFLAFYFRARDVRAPIVVDIKTEDSVINAPRGQMEDGVLFDDAALSVGATTTEVVATSTATTTAD